MKSTKAVINFPETFLQFALTSIVSILCTILLANFIKQESQEQGSKESRGS